MKVGNSILRFALELAALAALGYWGFHEHDGAASVLLGLGAPAVAAVAWGVFVSPRRPVRNEVVRWIVEATVFGAAGVALMAAGQAVLGVVLIVVAVLNGAVVRLLGEPVFVESAQ